MKCRFCGACASLPFVDLINAPLSNAYLTVDQLDEPEVYYPLMVNVCETCWLVQVDEYRSSGDIFSEKYAYFSSFSSSWLKHCQAYVEKMTHHLSLGSESFVVEIASNDGYLLQYFNAGKIPCLGIEPTASTAQAARQKGIDTLQEFFGSELATNLVTQYGKTDLMIGNNVLAHVPDINDFVKGFEIALQPTGVVTFEFPHLLNLIQRNQFDTIYHEHFSYLSLIALKQILESHGLTVYNVEALPTHGGSLRVYARHSANAELPVMPSVEACEKKERHARLDRSDGYLGLQKAIDQVRLAFLDFLHEQRHAGKNVAAYGAAAKGNTLINYCGIKGTELIEYVVDLSPHKQGLFLPGSHIPIVCEDQLRKTKPDYIVILPWNLREEIAEQLSYVRQWGARFVVCVPSLQVW